MVRIPITDKPVANGGYANENEVAEMRHQSAAPGATAGPTKNSGADEVTIPGDLPGAGEADPSVPSASQPEADASDENRTLGTEAAEVAGPGGAAVLGGDLTPAQDAGEAMQENLDQRAAEQEFGRQQQGGEVETQTKDLKPHPAHPDEGLSPSSTGKENSGGANAEATGAASDGAGEANASDTTVGASASDVARAGSEHDDRFLQLAADFENYKRQVARRESETRERAVLSVLEDILPVLDNFELAITHAKNAKDLDSVRIGVEHILQQLRNTLKSHGVEPLEATGQKFDPLCHEALEEVAGSGAPEGTIVGETQRGYAFKGQVLRPSRVRVSNGK